MNVTVSIDENLLSRAREAARRQGVTLNGLIRHFLETLVGEVSGQEAAASLVELMRSKGGHSGGKKLTRADAYEDRL